MKPLICKLNEQVWTSSVLATRIEAYLESAAVPSLERFKVITCIMEALGNVFCHTDCPEEQVILFINRDAQRLAIEITDQAKTTTITWPDECPDIEGERGRGLWIIRNWMDTAEYVPSEKGNRLYLELFLA